MITLKNKQSQLLKYTQNIMDESDIPIDIHTSKLLDWLISRRHVQKDWQAKVVKIREKINEAIKDMPEHKEITQLLSGSYINYFHCVKLVEILKETEANSKNMFGQYSSKRMKDWLEIIKLYTKDNIYLGEVASLLLRNVNYEVPALKKQITKTIHTKNEYEKKEVDYEKLAETYKKEFASICKSLGIKGKKIKKELLEKAADFPQMNQKLAEEMKSLKTGIDFYQNAVNYLLQNDDIVLKMLRYITEKGDTTVYEWKHNKPPSSVEANKLIMEEDTTEDSEDVIDFGTDINLDVEIDDNIDWGISAEDPEVPATELDDTVARGNEAFTILGNPDTRNSVVNDVLELESFLKARLYESKEDTGNFSSICPEVLQTYSKKSLQEMLSQVQSVLEQLRKPTSIHFLNITTNPRYVHQLAEKLEQKTAAIEKMQASKDFVRKQRDAVIKETESLNPKLDLLIRKTKELQDEIEREISKKYNNREVNLMGGAHLM